MKYWLVTVFLTFPLLVSSKEVLEVNKNDWNISLTDFYDVVATGKAMVIDVRQPHEVKAIRVDAKSYVNVPLNDLDEALNMEENDFEETYNVKKPQDVDPLVFICRSGKRSDTALRIARENNYFNTLHYNKGTNGWAENYPKLVVKQNPERKAEL